MMYNRTVVQPAIAFAASAQIISVLPTNPISHLIFTMRFLNVTDEATLAEILTAISNVEVLWNGEAITQINGADLFRLNMRMYNNTPFVANQVATDDAARWISMIVPFSRQLYRPTQGIPVTKAGQLQIRCTRSSSDAALSDQTLIVEAIEMLGASPESTMKITSLTPAAPAVGNNTVDIPREGKLAGILAFGTTVPTSTAFTKTINSLQLLVNNKQQYVTLGNWEALRGEGIWHIGQEKGAVTADGAANDEQYVYLDLDPLLDGSYLLETDPLNQLQLQIDAGDTNPYRFIPVRYVDSAHYRANA